MMELSKRIERLLEEHDFSLCGEITERYNDKGQYDIELETYSPEGENVIVSLTYDGTEEDFIREFIDYANGFNAEEHAEMWIEGRGKNGVPESIRDLLEDEEWIKYTLMQIAEELNSLYKESEELINHESIYAEEGAAMEKNILKAYVNARQEIDRWFCNAARDKNTRNKKDDAIECIFQIGKTYMLAQILETDFGEGTREDREHMKQIKDYLQFDFLENLEDQRS